MYIYKTFLNILFLFLISLEFSKGYIILPFKSVNPKFNIINDNSDNFVTNFRKELDKNKIYTTILIGEPKKDLLMYLSMEDSYFAIIKNYCTKEVISTYDPYSSKTFSIDTEKSISVSDFLNSKKGNDTIIFYNDTKFKEKLIINFDFLIVNETKNTIDDYLPGSFCGKIGLLKKYIYYHPFPVFIDYLKKINLIQNYKWGIFFFDKEKSYNINEEIQKKFDGFFIAGIKTDHYLKIFNINDISNAYISMLKTKYIGGKFDKIYFIHSKEEINCQKELNFDMNVDQNYILCKKDYYDNIKKYYFNHYLENNVCEEKISTLSYETKEYMIVCKATIKNELKKFPNLYLLYRQLNFTFSLDYNDLFMELDDKFYFLIIYIDRPFSIWNFGIILIKKYSFMFDEDKKSFYFIHLKKYNNNPIDPENDNDNDDHHDNSDNNNDDNDNNSDDNDNNNYANKTNDKNIPQEDNLNFWNEYKQYILSGLIIIVLIIGLVIGYIFGRKIYEKQRKTRANELDDNYEYIKENEDETIYNIIN